MIPLLRVMVAALLAAQLAPADPLIAENAIAKVSEHVHVIADRNVGLVPSVGIIQAELPATFFGWAAPARVGIIAPTAYTETP